MAAEAQRAPRVASELTNLSVAGAALLARTDPPKPAIERPKPIINSLTGGLDDTSCYIERLKALFESNNTDLGDLLESIDAGWARDRLYQTWMIFRLAGEKLEEVEELVAALTEKAHAEARERAA